MNKPLIVCLLILFYACAPTRPRPVEPLPQTVSGTPFIGISFATVNLNTAFSVAYPDAEYGLRVLRILQDSPAKKAGLRIGDIIVAYDAVSVDQTHKTDAAQAFADYIRAMKTGDALQLKLIRPDIVINGSRNGHPLDLHNPEALNALLSRQDFGETLAVRIEKKATVLNITIRVGRRPQMVTPQSADNIQQHSDPVFVDATPGPIETLCRELIDKYNLTPRLVDTCQKIQEEASLRPASRIPLVMQACHNPFSLFPSVDRMTDTLMAASRSDGISAVLKNAAAFTNLTNSTEGKMLIDNQPPNASDSLEQHIRYIEDVLAAAEVQRNRAFRNITAGDQLFLVSHLPDLMRRIYQSEDIAGSPDALRFENDIRAVNLAARVDYASLLKAALLLTRLTDPAWLADLENVTRKAETITSRYGAIFYQNKIAGGALIIGGPGPNRYSLDATVIIDTGGDDSYTGRTAADASNPLNFIIDLAGNDYYASYTAAAQGSGIFGIGVLVDFDGNDQYIGTDLCQGAGLMGVGILADLAGNDIYRAREAAQGFGLWGIGVLFDNSGNDRYSAALLAQGVGGPSGTGLLLDETGADTYTALGEYASTYGTAGIFNGLSQGLGFGLRGIAAGGVGLLLDGGGPDLFEAGNFSQGGSYANGLGVLRNAGADDDRYIGSRYAQGFAAHLGGGVLIDDGGNDHYSGRVGALQSAAWDLGIAALVDKNGNDTYEARDLFFCQGAAAHTSVSVFIDLAGEDTYLEPPLPRIPGNAYHDVPSFGFFIDAGGNTDQYMNETDRNNYEYQEGEFGFFMDTGNRIR